MDLIAATLVMWKMVVGFGMWRGAVFFKEKWAWNELDIDAYKVERSEKPEDDEESESIYSKFAYHSRGLEENLPLNQNDQDSGEVNKPSC